ncbi:HupE/UreJ family protein [Armatimonas sp.]|uniref:HupE/UreJ family protein n=1 Tax=Armatimonas sp. TaxID=1872638 RepID=UPI00375280BD
MRHAPLPYLLMALWCTLFGTVRAQAHDIPRTQVELRLAPAGAEAIVTFAVTGFTLDYPALQLDGTIFESALATAQPQLEKIIAERLVVTADGQALSPVQEKPGVFLPERKAIRLRLHYRWAATPTQLVLETGKLFPIDPQHTVFVSLYDAPTATLLSESLCTHAEPTVTYNAGSSQNLLSVIRQFIGEGVHHIFIGPDHILFVVGLLLLGGNLRALLKIVTAFTLAHSLTLVLATVHLLSPSPALIEPTIALSIIFVGIHGLLQLARFPVEKAPGDQRIALAFVFGLIHGFGFANVLQELALPRAALGWSLFSFNVGVELGQACIVLTVAPLLAMITRRDKALARRIVQTGLWVVVLAGAYWLGERL